MSLFLSTNTLSMCAYMCIRTFLVRRRGVWKRVGKRREREASRAPHLLSRFIITQLDTLDHLMKKRGGGGRGRNRF